MNSRVCAAAGWQIDFADDFRHRLLEVEAWDADLVESENGWFDLDMGIIVEGERLPLGARCSPPCSGVTGAGWTPACWRRSPTRR
jgi:hypothetical protein